MLLEQKLENYIRETIIELECNNKIDHINYNDHNSELSKLLNFIKRYNIEELIIIIVKKIIELNNESNNESEKDDEIYEMRQVLFNKFINLMLEFMKFIIYIVMNKKI